MYFKEKEDTNIDSEFNKKRGINFNLKKINPKLMLTIGGVILLIVLLLIVISLIKNNNKYTIELYGEETITIALGGDYIEPGYKAYDKKNNDYTKQVEITSTVDTSKAGEYEILYSINRITKIRYVIVSENYSKARIHLKGNLEMYLEVGEKYKEPGYEVYDSIDKNLSSSVVVTGNIDTSKVGTYLLTYTIVNSRNATTTVTRTVYVVEKGKKP